MYDQIKTEEYMPKKGKTGKIFKVVGIALALAAVIGLCIFLMVLLNNQTKKNKAKKEEEKAKTNIEETISIEKPRIVTLYNYVTYGREDGNNKDYFLTNKNISIKNFENAEKIFYATQFLEADNFLDTGKTSDDKKIYAVSIEDFEKALKKFFGSVVEYEREGSYRVVLPFVKDGGSLVNLVYDDSIKSFTSTFNAAPAVNNNIKNHYTKLIKATKKGDKTTLTEKVIYTSQQASGSNTIINIYSDYAKTRLIESKTVATDSINNDTINIDNYLEKANTIEYVFKEVDKQYYFESSEIKN